MTVESLSPNDFLRLEKADIDNMFQETMPPSEGESCFEPAKYSSLTNPLLLKMRGWKGDYMKKAVERRSILNYIVPALLLGPGTISLIIAAHPMITAMIFTVGTMVILGFLWFYGRVWAWESKHYATNLTDAEKACERTKHQRAREWADARYDLPSTQNIEWAEFSEFHINHRSYKWEEVEEGKFIIFDQQADKEAPLRKII